VRRIKGDVTDPMEKIFSLGDGGGPSFNLTMMQNPRISGGDQRRSVNNSGGSIMTGGFNSSSRS